MARTSCVALTALVAGVLLAACGSRTNPLLEGLTDAASEGGTTLLDGSPPPMDAGSLDTSTSAEDAGPTNSGLIAFVNSAGVYGEGAGGTNMVSRFRAEFVLGSVDAGCTTSQPSGACVYQSCPPGPQAGLVSAGTLTIGGGELPGALPVAPDSNNFYSYSNMAAMGPDTFFRPGNMLTVSASGSIVPAFAAAWIAAPGSVTLNAPTPSASGLYTVDTSHDLTVQWSAGEAGADFVLQGGGGGETYFMCTWDATLGQGVVPHSVLTPFSPAVSGAHGINGELVWYQQRTSTFTAGTFAIQESLAQYSDSANAAFY